MANKEWKNLKVKRSCMCGWCFQQTMYHMEAYMGNRIEGECEDCGDEREVFNCLLVSPIQEEE